MARNQVAAGSNPAIPTKYASLVQPGRTVARLATCRWFKSITRYQTMRMSHSGYCTSLPRKISWVRVPSSAPNNALAMDPAPGLLSPLASVRFAPSAPNTPSPLDGSRCPTLADDGSTPSEGTIHAELMGIGIPGSLKTIRFSVRGRGSAPMRSWWNRKTRAAQTRVPQGVQVQVLSGAPFRSLSSDGRALP